MNEQASKQLGTLLWSIADQLRGAMNADDFRDYMLSFLFLRYLSDNYEATAQKELGGDYPALANDDNRTPLAVWYKQNPYEKDTEFAIFHGDTLTNDWKMLQFDAIVANPPL